MDTRVLETESERRLAVPILRQLWTDADPASVLSWTGSDDYHLFGRFDGRTLIGVAGVLEAHHLHHVRHAWLYDLVVDGPRRGEGHGTALVDDVESWATDRGCEYVALASPALKDGVHEFYERNGYETWGYVIEKEL
ncbi:GNAT family N-acetyltransferase [Halosolutus gelatinilyticus]|uniref:GNAT family N-acetyltransferase n=1 Tax=Halosolutus gelatinilyticus TaxID=2931975 RepID=UPI001FF4BE04|nr:GNAT family N-acetyltransferase [Halosolutus gelatinilyticus]